MIARRNMAIVAVTISVWLVWLFLAEDEAPYEALLQQYEILQASDCRQIAALTASGMDVEEHPDSYDQVLTRCQTLQNMSIDEFVRTMSQTDRSMFR